MNHTEDSKGLRGQESSVTHSHASYYDGVGISYTDAKPICAQQMLQNTHR